MASNPSTLPSWAKRLDDPNPPDGWRETPLTSVADIRFSGVDKKSYAGEKPVRLCNYMDVYNKEYVYGHEDFMHATASKAEISRFALEDGDVIITKDSETPDDIGVPAVVLAVPSDLLCGYHLALIRPHRDQVDPLFLAKQLGHTRVSRYYARLANGLTRYGLTNAVVENTPVWLPEIDEQRRVATTHRAIDEAIIKTEALIAKLKVVKQGLLHDLLTRGLDDNGQLRDSVKHPDQFKDSPLGRFPKSWDIEALGAICSKYGGSIQTGPFGSQLHAGDYVKHGTPIITVEHLGDGEIRHDGLPRVSEDDYRRLSRYRLQEGDLVFSRVGAIDRCARVRAEENGWLFSGRCLRVRPGNHGIDSFFLAYQLNSFQCRRWIVNNAVGSTMKCLNTSILGRLPVIEPPAREQQRIGRTLAFQDERIHSEESYLSKLKVIKKGLMQDLLTGRVRVPEATLGKAEAAV